MAANVKANLESFGCNVTFMTDDNLSIKRRYIDERSKQHIVRVDSDILSQEFDQSIIQDFSIYDAVVISDYNKGFVSYETIEQLRKKFSGPVFVDSKKQDIARFDGCFVKINETEYKQRYSICSTMIVTLGSNGAMYKQHYDEQHFPGKLVEVVDVCGAGDTFLAALTYKYLKSDSIETAIQFANDCAAISVQNQGVYCLTSEDLSSII
jgi:D-beta-D-heptose 7-phosphate kinase/D-beta-D-heptose 1-phosphate adenosyltransferase